MSRMIIAVALAGAGIVASRYHNRSVTEPRATPVIDSIASPASPGSAEPHLATGADGRVYLSWLEPVDSAFALKFSRFDGSRWETPRVIRTGRDFFVNWADFPSIQPLGGKRLAAHWLQRTGTSTYAYGVRIALSNDEGATWGAPISPHTDTSNTEHGFVSLWREADKLGAVWLDGRKFNKAGHNPSNEMTLASATFQPNGRYSSPETILDERVCDCCQTAAVKTSKGLLVAYRDRSPDEIRDIYVIRRDDVTPNRTRRWTEPRPVHRDNWKVNYCPVNGPQLSALDDRVALSWFTAANDSARVKLAFSDDAGEAFGAPIRIDNGNPAGRVDVELLKNGDALVTWIERTGGDTAAVRMRRVARNGAVGAPITVAMSSAARASGFPRMTIAGDHVMLAWTVPGRPSSVRVARIAIDDLK